MDTSVMAKIVTQWRTNLILHYSVAHTFDETDKRIRILDVVEKTLHIALLRQ